MIIAPKTQPSPGNSSMEREEPLQRHTWRALGTTCELQFPESKRTEGQAWAAAAQQWVERFEQRYSRFRPTSLISQINAAAGRGWVAIDAEMERFLDLCGSVHFMTRGVLDVTALPLQRLWDYRVDHPRLPSAKEVVAARELVGWEKVQRSPGKIALPRAGMCLDFGGWGKEYAVDAVVQLGREHGLSCGLVDFGHDVRGFGRPPGKPAWHIGLEDPEKPGTYRTSVAVQERGVASSGDYLRGFTLEGKRYGHIVDPRTGAPVANSALQVTVVAASCLQAGVLSTAAFILGAEEGTRLIQETMGAEGLIVTTKARHQTRGFFNYVV